MAYPWATPAPTYSSAPGVSTGTPGINWNQAWNMGYNNSTGSNPYSGDIGSGYAAGQQQYQADYARTHQSTPPPSGTGIQTTGGTVLGTQAPPQDTGGGTDPNAALNNAFNDYYNSLDAQMANLPGQRSNLEETANSQLNQAVNTGQLTADQATTQLGNETTQTNQNQVKSLADLANNIRNSMMAGQVYLGAQGAGDSSAANQYAYALTKLGSQQRSGIVNNTANILADINGRIDTVKQTWATQKQNLQEQANQNLLGIAKWFTDAQNSISNLKGQAALQKSQDILNQGLAALQNVQNQATARQNALDTWAINNSTSLGNLQKNLQAVSTTNYQLPAATPLTSTPQVSSNGALTVGPGTQGNLASTNQYPYANLNNTQLPYLQNLQA